LQKNSSFLHQIILKDLQEDDEDDKEEKSEDEDEEEESEESEEGESKGGIPSFDKKLSNSTYTFSNKNRTCVHGSLGSVHTVVGTKCDKFAFKILAVTNIDLRFGFGNAKIINKDLNTNFSTNGNYYYYIYSGYKYVNSSPIYCIAGGASCENIGTVFGLKYDKKKKTITLFKGKDSQGVLYDNVPKGIKLLPVFDMTQSGGSVEFIKPEFK